MTLKQIIKNKLLSVRAYNVCGQNKLYTLNLILDYYKQHSSFKKLRGCGYGTNVELIEFCRKQHSNSDDEQQVEKYKISFSSLIPKLSRKQREVINSFIHINTIDLSVRSQNAVRLHLQGNLRIKNFSRRFFDANVDVRNMKNVGKISIPEIETFIEIIKDFFHEISSIKDEEKLTVLRNQFLIQKTFSLYHVPRDVFKSESIFYLADFLLRKNALFDKKETVILRKSLNIYDNIEEILLEDIGQILGLTRERVRQIRKKCIEDLFTKFDFLRNFNDDLYSNYGIEEGAKFVFVDNELKSRINKYSQSNFSSDFITFLLYTSQAEFYSLIGNVEDVLQTNYFNNRNRHNWKSFYLVSKGIYAEFSFNNFLDDVSSRLDERITETYTFNFKSYISKFLTNNKLEVLHELMPIAEKIVYEELDIIVDLEDNISFKRNTLKLAFEYAFEALEHLGKPSTVKEIVTTIHGFHPNYETDELKVRAAMKRKHGFVPIGRRSIFGLKKWEMELENFKGGTIRTITEEYLQDFANPVHKQEIAKHVKQFRPKTNANSIYNNLYVDKTFVFFENYFVGLASKQYSNEFRSLSKTAPPSKRTWHESLEALQNFIDQYNRLPYSSGCPESEQKLYRWLNVQKGKSKKNKLDEGQKSIIDSIIARFEDEIGYRKTLNAERYNELKDFVTQNSRLPSANINGEKNLYAFHYKQRKKFESDELDEDGKKNLIEVARILQKQSI